MSRVAVDPDVEIAGRSVLVGLHLQVVKDRHRSHDDRVEATVLKLGDEGMGLLGSRRNMNPGILEKRSDLALAKVSVDAIHLASWADLELGDREGEDMR